jgi:predicted DNA-binding ribbon-helix-helix protein
LAKHQTGIRIDRILFKQFQEICQREKLRPGEAVESLIRLAVQAGSITSVSIDNPKTENTTRTFDDALFRSRLARLKTSLELEEQYWKETGRHIEDDYKESETFIERLTELGRRSVSPELVKEFEAILTSADKQYQQMQKSYYEKEINDHKA